LKVRLKWEPESGIPLEELEKIACHLTDGKGNVTILKNGTLLFVHSSNNDEENARELSEAFDELYGFEVVPVDIGGYLVGFHEAVAVFVTEKEFQENREEIISRLEQLFFPDEIFQASDNIPQDHALIGMYARGKLRRDASDFCFYKRI
jgi:hypothetical protein